MSEYNVNSNSVGKDASRIIHLEVLKEISDIVMKTAGPKGSTAMIMKGAEFPVYSKDGKKVAENVKLHGTIENGILDQIIQIVQNVVSRVGDGTTSAIRLTYMIFVELVKWEMRNDKKTNSYDIVSHFKKAAKLISDRVKHNSKPFTLDAVYDICMISTNGNEELSNIITKLYKKYGDGVYIDLKSSNTSDYMTKEYDGLSIEKGYATPAYINRQDGTCHLRNAKIYVFKDPIDTPEMIGFFTRIVYDNVLTPFNNLRMINQIKNNPQLARSYTGAQLDDLSNNSDMIPTVIMCPFMSRDLATTLETLESLLYSFDADETTRMNKPPIMIVNNLSRNLDELSDISLLCGCKVIAKYIDESVQQADIESGKAPTIDTVTSFYGFAEEVIGYDGHTKFINPQNMFVTEEVDGETKFALDENGNRIYSETYNSIVNFLKSQLDLAEKEGDIVAIRMLKRRVSTLTSSLVELYIGGISITDRESVKDLADDAVRNCRSAAASGIGYGANFEGFIAARDILTEKGLAIDKTTKEFINIIYNAYISVIREIYEKSIPLERVQDEVDKSFVAGKPINLRTYPEEGPDVLTSIDTDVAILDCISRIVSIMFTTNQILIESPFDNTYAAIDTSELWEQIKASAKNEVV